MSFLEALNEEQLKAVKHIDGPMMIVAGAGSGKTRVLTYRIAYMLEQGVDSFNILALTFTNKASRDMRQRIEQVIGNEARNLWMGTFHSVFARLLRVEASKLGYPSNFTIYDTEDTKSLIKAIVKEEGLDDKLYKPSIVYNNISLAKNNFISVQKYQDDPEIQAHNQANGRPKLGLLYETYSRRCFKAGAMDFDDLLLNTYKLLDKHPDMLNKYQHKFKYLMVDEYQDTNHIQYLIIKKLASVHQNICVVGDDAQSIYAFRGANIRNILNFEKDFPNMSVYKLEQNYRSTKVIVNAASDVIRNNKEQLKKELWTANDAGNNIKVFKAFTDNEEGIMVARSIYDEKLSANRKNKDFAILYRTNAQSRSFEEALRKMNIAYKIIGGISFYQRKEIKDVLAYFRLAINAKDEEAIKRVINYPTRGIGKTSLEKIIAAANDHDISLWEVMQGIQDFGFDNRVSRKVSEFVNMIQSFNAELEQKNAYELATQILKSTGIASLLYEDKSIEGIARHENLQELAGAIKQYISREDIEDKSLSGFMQEVALLTDADQNDDDTDVVTLMTIHSSKGLEFPCVYVTGLEENLLPSQMALNSREELEEERRLFYVAITRGEEKVTFSYATSRFKWGNVIPCEPSRFLEEVNPKYLEFVIPKQAQKMSLPKQPVTSIRKTLQQKKEAFKKATTHEVRPGFVPEHISELSVGMEIEHSKFGVGKVVQVEGSTGNQKASIFFNNFGNKQILLKYAKIRIHKG